MPTSGMRDDGVGDVRCQPASRRVAMRELGILLWLFALVLALARNPIMVQRAVEILQHWLR